METTSPVDGDVAFVSVEACSPFHTATGTDSTKLKKPVKYRTVVADIISTLLACKRVHVVGGYFPQEVDVFVGMELRHFKLGGRFGALKGNNVSISKVIADRSEANMQPLNKRHATASGRK